MALKMTFFGTGVVAIAACIAMVGCERKSDARPTAPAVEAQFEHATIATPLYKTAAEALKNATFTCAAGTDCSLSVGMLYTEAIDKNASAEDQATAREELGRESAEEISASNDELLLQQCTAFLISDSIVATNAHCVPNYMKITGQCDAENLSIRFLPTGAGAGATQFGCKRIIDISHIEKTSALAMDFAFIEIEPTGREPLKVQRNGVLDNQVVKIARVTPASKKGGGILETNTCTVAHHSILNLESVSRWSQTLVAPECASVPGNSGSPVLNENNEAIAIVYAVPKATYRDGMSKQYEKMGIKLPDEIRPFVLMSNLSCILDPVTRDYAHDECERAKKLNFYSCSNFNTSKNNENLDAVQMPWEAKLPAQMLYKIATSKDGTSLQATPLCIRDDKTVKTIDLKLASGLNFATQSTLDTKYRIQRELRYSAVSENESHLELLKTGSKWIGTMTSSSTVSKLKLSTCSPAQIKNGNIGAAGQPRKLSGAYVGDRICNQ